MKKLSLLSSIFVITLFLASCGGSEDKNDGGSEDKKGVVDPVTDTDGDGINDFKADGTTKLDRCQPSEDITFRSTAANDRDSDGCEDAGEDKDDDNDGINDVDINGNELDQCPEGIIGIGNDLDNDGCKNSKDTDDDNDTILDTADACPRGIIGTNDPDADSDGCKDSVDVDDDNNGLIEIATAAELDNIRYQLDGTSYKTSANDIGSDTGCPTADPVGCNGYELAGDIDLSSITDFEPIGPSGSPFTAIFEGNGNTISNLIISNDTRYVGFFGILGASSEVRNLSFAKSATDTGSVTSRNISISTEIGSVGTLAGENRGTISNVSTALSVSVDLNTSVTGPKYVGGLVGESTSTGTIQNSSATGNVSGGSGGDTIGGLTGSGTVTNSYYSTGTVDGGSGNDTVGGLTGSGTVTNSYYSTGTVDGGSDNDRVGGLTGLGSVTNSYSTGTVNGGSGNDKVGGLTGLGSVTNSYSIATVNGGTGTDTVGHLTVPISISANPVVTNSYYDSGITPTEGTLQTYGTGKTSDQLKAINNVASITDTTCTSAGGTWDGTACTDGHLNLSTDNWDFTAGKYPSLKSYKVDANDAQIAGDLLCNQPTDFVQCAMP